MSAKENMRDLMSATDNLSELISATRNLMLSTDPSPRSRSNPRIDRRSNPFFPPSPPEPSTSKTEESEAEKKQRVNSFLAKYQSLHAEDVEKEIKDEHQENANPNEEVRHSYTPENSECDDFEDFDPSIFDNSDDGNFYPERSYEDEIIFPEMSGEEERNFAAMEEEQKAIELEFSASNAIDRYTEVPPVPKQRSNPFLIPPKPRIDHNYSLPPTAEPEPEHSAVPVAEPEPAFAPAIPTGQALLRSPGKNSQFPVRDYCNTCAKYGAVENCAEEHWKPDGSTYRKIVTYPLYPAVTTTTYSHIGCRPRTAFDRGHSCDYSTNLPYFSGDPTGEGLSKLSKYEQHIQMKRLILLSQGKDDSKMPEEIRANPEMLKYWYSRYQLFRKYDQGIKLDLESWYSVTLESIAIEIAEHCSIVGGTIVDAFCGCGGNTIQFAKMGMNVIAIDIDPVKVEYAKHNAGIYGVADKITFMVADFLAVAASLHADAIFLSPPWGGPEYMNCKIFKLDMIPLNGITVFKAAQRVSPNVCYYLPRHVDLPQLQKLAGHGNLVEIHENTFEGKRKSITAYYGKLVRDFTPTNGAVYKGL